MQTIIRNPSLVILLLFSSSQLNAQSIDSTIYMTTLDYFYKEVIENPKASCITLSHKYAEFSLFGTSSSNILKHLDSSLMNNFLKNIGYCDSCVAIQESEFTSYLHKIFDGIPNVYIISEEKAGGLAKKSARRNDFWKRLFKKYPCSGGLLFLSYIGYNDAKTEAILYMENLFHSLAGGGFLAICELKEGVWSVQRIEAVIDI